MSDKLQIQSYSHHIQCMYTPITDHQFVYDDGQKSQIPMIS